MKDFDIFEKRFRELWQKIETRTVHSALDSLEGKIIEQNRRYKQCLALLRKIDGIATLEELNTFKRYAKEVV